jgi:phosphoheptose isomerase
MSKLRTNNFMFSNSDAVSIIIESIEVKKRLSEDSEIITKVLSIARLMIDSLVSVGRIFFAGNGGSALDAQHLAAELVSRFEHDRPGLPALSLSTDTSMITAMPRRPGLLRFWQNCPRGMTQ